MRFWDEEKDPDILKGSLLEVHRYRVLETPFFTIFWKPGGFNRHFGEFSEPVPSCLDFNDMS